MKRSLVILLALAALSGTAHAQERAYAQSEDGSVKLTLTQNECFNPLVLLLARASNYLGPLKAAEATYQDAPIAACWGPYPNAQVIVYYEDSDMGFIPQSQFRSVPPEPAK